MILPEMAAENYEVPFVPAVPLTREEALACVRWTVQKTITGRDNNKPEAMNDPLIKHCTDSSFRVYP